MADLRRALDGEVPTRHPVFEAGQVLTHEQINDAVGYLDAQERLARVSLGGIGIACGLRASLAAGAVTVGCGVGVTSDGDLVRLAADRRFARYRRYDETAPRYAPFLRDPAGGDERRIPAWELVDEGDAPLSEFAAREAEPLEGTAAVLVVESHDKLDTLCTGTDCDNRGGDRRHDLRVVLVRAADAARFLESLATPDAVARRCADVVVARPAVTGFSDATALRGAYRAASDATRASLTAAVDAFLDADGAASLVDAALLASMRTWAATLAAHAATPAATSHAQYFHAFLCDLADTWNAFRDGLFDVTTVCAPPAGAFPKHLLLGGPSATATARTGFYPAPAGAPRDETARARALLERLDAMIPAFAVPSNAAVKITPSAAAERALEDRAIPFYYSPQSTPSVRERWNPRRRRRGDTAATPSYHDAADRFATSIARHTFFRVEGHIGMKVDAAVQAVEEAVARCNVAVAVEAVRLHATGPTLRPRVRRFTDFERFERAIRADLTRHLDDAVTFTRDLDTHVTSVASTRLPAERSEQVKGVVRTRANALAQKVTAVKQQLGNAGPADDTWRATAAEILGEGVRLKSDLRDVSKSHSVSPLDRLMAFPHFNLLDIFDDLFRDRGVARDERQRFAAYLKQNPGLEHLGGAAPGGTLVLAYGPDGTVVADFALPYRCCEDGDEREPDLSPRPGRIPIRPPVSVGDLFDIEKPFEVRIGEGIEGVLKPRLAVQDQLIRKQQEDLDKTLDRQTTTVRSFFESQTATLSQTFSQQATAHLQTVNDRIAAAETSFNRQISDKVGGLEGQLNNHRTQTTALFTVAAQNMTETVKVVTGTNVRPRVADATFAASVGNTNNALAGLRRARLTPGPASAAAIRAQEEAVVTAAVSVVKQVRDSGASLDEGSEARVALETAAGAVGIVKSPEVLARLNTQVNALAAGEGARVVAAFRNLAGLP